MVYRKNGILRKEILSKSDDEGSSVGMAIRSLEQKGYVSRRQDPDDRRTQKVYITDEGLGLKDDLLEINSSVERYITSGVEPRELEVLKRVISNLCS
jgi:DNA-binding MarR family transcriptional regulator